MINLDKCKLFYQKNKWLVLVILAILGTFYWYEFRPSQIKKECSTYFVERTANEGKIKLPGYYRNANDQEYKECLRLNGL